MKKLCGVLLLGLMLSGCMFVHKMDIEQGNVVTPEMVAELHPGMSEKQVRDVMGSPILLNTFNDNREDYVYTYKPGGGKMSENNVVVMFRNGRVRAISGSMYSPQ